VRGVWSGEMHTWEQCNLLLDAVLTHCRVQVAVLFNLKLWTSSMRPRESGALQFSARLETVWPPHRCRIKDSRSSLGAAVRHVTVIAMIAGRVAV
jgi:hypothetical protein